MTILTMAIIGGLGGSLRALVGLGKALKKKEQLNASHFLLTMVISVIIGFVVGYIFTTDIRVALLAGYAGTDILEGLSKALTKKAYGVL